MNDYNQWSKAKLYEEVKSRKLFVRSNTEKDGLISILMSNDVYNEILENYKEDYSESKVLVQNIIPLEFRDFAKRKQRFIKAYNLSEIEEIFDIIKSDVPLISLLPYQTKTIGNAKELFEVSEILWYSHANNLLYTLKNGMFVLINFNIKFEFDNSDWYQEEHTESIENIRIYVNESLEPILKYGLSNNDYVTYLNDTEPYIKALAPRDYEDRSDKDHDPDNFFEYIMQNFDFRNPEPITKDSKLDKSKIYKYFDTIYWAHFNNFYTNKINYLLYGNHENYFLLIFRNNKHINFSGNAKIELQVLNFYYSSSYKAIIDFLPENIYKLYLNETVYFSDDLENKKRHEEKVSEILEILRKSKK
jgi:hypothetical protein